MNTFIRAHKPGHERFIAPLLGNRRPPVITRPDPAQARQDELRIAIERQRERDDD